MCTNMRADGFVDIVNIFLVTLSVCLLQKRRRRSGGLRMEQPIGAAQSSTRVLRAHRTESHTDTEKMQVYVDDPALAVKGSPAYDCNSEFPCVRSRCRP